MATGDILVAVGQVTKQIGTNVSETAVIPVAEFAANNTSVEFFVVPRETDGKNVTYDVIAVGKDA